MNYHPMTWLTWFAWGFFMSCGWWIGSMTCAITHDAIMRYRKRKAV